MKPSEAHAIVAFVTAYWPNPGLPEPTVQAWAGAIEDESFTLDDAQRGIRSLASVNRRCPSLAEIITAAHGERKVRQSRALALDGEQDFPMMSDLFPNVEKP